MTKPPLEIPRHSVAETILILIVGAELGALVAIFLAAFATSLGVTGGNPLGLVVIGPLVLARYGVTFMYVLIGTPIWAFLGGLIFEDTSSGETGVVARNLGIKFFPEEHPIARATQRMATELDIPPVKFIGWYSSLDVNAFAMGTEPNNTLVALSQGAIEKLTRDELDAVIAHELGHIACNDMARMTYALNIREALTFFLIFRQLKTFALRVFTPISELVLLRFSRQREFVADAISAQLTSPGAMISVLHTLADATEAPETHGQAMAMMSAQFSNSWFSTHPSLEDRIAALQSFKAAAGLPVPGELTIAK